MDLNKRFNFGALTVAAFAAAAGLASPAFAAPALRTQMDVPGDFVLFGNTLNHECNGAPAPIVGTVGPGCTNSNTRAPDVYWQADPVSGTAVANNAVTLGNATSVSVLQLPADAQVVYARLYWGGLVPLGVTTADTEVTLRRQDVFEASVTADDSTVIGRPASLVNFFSPRSIYQGTADVTALVAAQGAGAYQLAGVRAALDEDEISVAGWYMVVFYQKPGAPQRNLAIFDGLDYVAGNNGAATVSLSGFLVPNAGFKAALGVVAFEGENQFINDRLSFNGTDLTNALNPVNDFFNATRSEFGVAVNSVGDLPQLTGEPGSLSNMDMDVVDVTSLVAAGQTSAQIEASSLSDIFILSAFVTSISTFAPDFSSSTKTAVDDNGGEVLRGDTLTYTLTVRNEGSDAAEQVIITDALPADVTFVPGSVEITTGANMGAKTDSVGDDQVDYDSATRKLTVRLGTGADAAQGGALEIGEETSVAFKVTVNADAQSEIENQGVITFVGRQGAPASETPTDSDTTAPGRTPVVVVVSCSDDSECAAPTPFCDLAAVPASCVPCATSAQCTDTAAPDCNPDTNVCECAAQDGMCIDTDGDGLSDPAEEDIGTDPNDSDTDDDGVPDGAEYGPKDDTDGDGLPNALDPDSDNDGLPDGLEQGFSCDDPGIDLTKGNCRPDGDMGATTTNPVKADTDGGGATDGSEDSNLNGVVDAGERDPTVGNAADDVGIPDMDGDGLSDALEETLHSDPNDGDSDDDGLPDGEEPNPSTDADGDGLTSILDTDSDNDGLFDGTEAGKDCSSDQTDASAGHCRADADMGATTTALLDPDTDHGGVSDGSEDFNLDGAVDAGETNPVAGNGGDDATVVDTDGDGLSDDLEATLGTDPGNGDSDNDGVSDGKEPNPSDDQDGDGLVNAVDSDSDNDALFDGTELGLGCDGADTDVTLGQCIADSDAGATKTSPINDDTDFGGATDGSEDSNLNGGLDSGELDPTLGHGDDDGDIEDADGDGLSDDLEETLHSDPNDGDSDDDGLPDGEEPNPSSDTDGDGLTSILDADSDNDGLLDGTEAGKSCDGPETNISAGHCRADADMGATTTSLLDPDTDNGGVSDGSEDFNLDGAVDAGETNPVAGNGADDATVVDTDGDGLSDGLEATIGTDPENGDTDNDGVSDGKEPNPSDDQDGDGLVNAVDSDSDGDGIFDGTELGFGCDEPDTDVSAGQCVADADAGATKTSPLNSDTDFGGRVDAAEDLNKNGRVDAGETDPNDPADDGDCLEDTDCGDAMSGRVCEDGMCVVGCRAGGNGCPTGQSCTVTTGTEPGMCEVVMDTPDGGMAEPPPTVEPDAGITDLGEFGGGGCDCAVGPRGHGNALGSLLVMGLALGIATRRRRRG